MRVLSGMWQNRRIDPPKGIRPMTEMVKQALFHVIGNLGGATVLDLFAGSGQIGIEALSRGAKFTAFVEADRSNAEHLRRTLKTLGETGESARVLCQDVHAYLKATKSSFDLVLADPPYGKGLAAPTLEAVAAHATLLRPGSRFVLRHTKHEPVGDAATPSLEPEFERAYGDDVVRIWRKR